MIAPRPFWRSTPRIPGTFLPSPRRCVVVFVASTCSPSSRLNFSPSNNGHEKRACALASSSSSSHRPLTSRTNLLSNDPTKQHQALEKVPQSDSAKFTYNADKHTFNYLVDSGFTYLVVADDACGRQLPFQFLEKVKGIFAQKFAGSVGENANAHSLDRTFGPTLKKEMEETMALEQLSGGGGGAQNGAVGNTKVASVQQQVSEVKEIMMDNIEKVLDRGEKIEVLVDKTEALRFQADNFHKQGRALRNRMWWNNLKMKLILLTFVIGVGIIIFCVFCFGGEKNCTAKKKKSSEEVARRLARRLLFLVTGVEGEDVDGNVEMESNRGGAIFLENGN